MTIHAWQYYKKAAFHSLEIIISKTQPQKKRNNPISVVRDVEDGERQVSAMDISFHPSPPQPARHISLDVL